MEMKKRKAIHIVIAYMYNIVFIIMSFAMMKSYCYDLQITFLVSGVLFLIYWIICSRKSYMPWSVYCHFLVGVVAQVLLNTFGIIPPDAGLFSGLGQFFYVVFVITLALIVGLANLILFVIAKRKSAKGRNNVSALEFLQNAVVGKNNLDELISVFEEMCEIPIKEEEEKMILFETGTYSFTGEPMFNFSLVRQYPNEEEEYYQIHLDIMFEPTENNSSFEQAIWSFDIEESIFEYIRKSEEYSVLKSVPVAKVDAYIDET